MDNKSDMEELKQWCDYVHLPYEAMSWHWDIIENETLWVPTSSNPHYSLGFNDTGNFVVMNLGPNCPWPLPSVSVVPKDEMLNILHIILKEYYEE